MVWLTRAQRQWQPGMQKKQSSLKHTLAAMVLSLEALVAFFGTLATFGMNFSASQGHKTLIWTLGLGLALAFLLSPALLKKTGGYQLGWILQALLLMSGLVLPAMFFVALCFCGAYWYALRTGSRLDQENKVRAQRQAEWEQSNS